MNFSKQYLELLDTGFESFVLSILNYGTNNSTDSKIKRRSLADKSDLDFASIYFPEIFNEPWNKLHEFVANIHSGFYTISGARKFGKSALVFVTKVIKRLALGGPGIINISLRTQEKARERTASIVRMIVSNSLLLNDYSIKVLQNKKGYYIINNKHLIGTSVQLGLRGITDDNFKRFEVSINDDLYNKNSVSSKTDNQKVVDFITSEVYGQMENNGLCITLGNSISEFCPIREISKSNPANHFSLPATNEDGKTNWEGHSVYSNEYWKEFKKTLPYDVWMGEYMDKPVQIGNVFDLSWISFVNLVNYKISDTLIVVDPGSGESAASCFKAVGVISRCESGKLICSDIYIRREDYYFLFDYLFWAVNNFPNVKSVKFENDFNQWVIAKPYYDNWVKKTGKLIPFSFFRAKSLSTYNYGSDKNSRIMNLVFPLQTGMLLFNEELKDKEDFKELKNQLVQFGKSGTEVDGIDALASAFILSVKNFNKEPINTFKPINKEGRKWLINF